MKKSELKQLIHSVVTEGAGEMNAFLDQQIDRQKNDTSNANKNAQKLVGKTIKTIDVNPKYGDIKIQFSDGTLVDFGEVDGVFSFDGISENKSMKKSEIKSIIRECIEEVVAEQAVMQEAALMHDVEKFFASINPALKNSFIRLIFPLLQKSSENVEDKKRYVIDLIGAISNPQQVKGYISKLMNDNGIDLKRDAVELNKLLPILSDLQKYVSGQR